MTDVVNKQISGMLDRAGILINKGEIKAALELLGAAATALQATYDAS